MKRNHTKGFSLIYPLRRTDRIRVNKGFTLIELLVVISIIAFLSAAVFATLKTARVKARDSARIQNARQIALALEQYEQSNNTYKVSNSGLSTDHGTGYIAKGAETPGYTNSILSSLKQAGFVNSTTLNDPIYGTDNYYVGLCTSTNAYNVFIKLEQPELSQSTTTLFGACGGIEAASQGFNFVATTIGSNTGGAGDPNTLKSSSTESGTYVYPEYLLAAAGSFDAAFNKGKGPSNIVNASAIQSDGKVIIGGSFLAFNSSQSSRIARLNADGSVDASFNIGSGFNGNVNVIKIQPDGKILVGGTFSTYNGASMNAIIRLNADGDVDTGFNVGSGAFGGVSAIDLLADGKIVIGGGFTTYNGVARKYVARLNADGTLDTNFDPGTGPNGYFAGLAVQSDGKIIIVGRFTTYQGTARQYVARINIDGTLDTSFAPGSGPNGYPYSTIIQSDGKILVTGAFTSYNGTSANYIVRVNTDGTVDTSFNSGTLSAAVIVTAGIQSDGKIMIGGALWTINGVARNEIARLNSDGSLDTSFDPGAGASNQVTNMVIQSNGKIVIGGYFKSYNNFGRLYVARINSNGSLDMSFNPGGGFGEYVTSSIMQPDGKIIFAGDFTSYNDTLVNRVARINADGSIDSSFNPGSLVDGEVESMALIPDGKIYIGGWFNNWSSGPKNLARLNSDGSHDTNFDIGTGLDGDVMTIAVQSDGKVLIGGNFNNYNGNARPGLARINPDGSFDSSFNIGTGPTSDVYSILLQPDGKIIVAGGFWHYNGDNNRNRIVRLNPDGSLDTEFNVGPGPNDYIYAAALLPDGKVLISGDFRNVDGTAINYLARLGSNGSIDTSFNTGSGPTYCAKTFAIQPDGKVYIGGYFTSYNGIARSNLARINLDGSLDTTFNTGGILDNDVITSLLLPDGKLLIGGYFKSFNNMPVGYIARFQ